jgi:hypothetical protein
MIPVGIKRCINLLPTYTAPTYAMPIPPAIARLPLNAKAPTGKTTDTALLTKKAIKISYLSYLDPILAVHNEPIYRNAHSY